MHLPQLIIDLALILGAAGIITLLFKRLKQPMVLGYIIAGFIVGPNFHLFPTIADSEGIKTWSEIGVIFLLFSLGLEFSFKKLMRVGGTAAITAFVEITCITIAGYYVGQLMGWGTMDSLFLGGLLASSSTTIIIRAFEELGIKKKPFTKIVFGVLVIEDIVVILMMVLLSTMAVSRQFEGTEMIFTILKLSFFLAIWFLAGIFLLPTFLKKMEKYINSETLLILSIALCLGMVILATQVGFSAELGAFIMGSIIAETTVSEKVEHLIQPVKDLFGAIFFVSVGMLIDPKMIGEYWAPVLWVTLLTIVGKFVSTSAGALLSGQTLRQSVQVGMSMAQVGEFAFIIATLGLSLGVTSDFLFPVAVGVSAITTFTTPYMIKFSVPLYEWLERVLPEKWLNTLNRYSASSQTLQADSDWKIVLRSYIRVIVLNSVIMMGVILLNVYYIGPFVMKYIQNEWLARILSVLIGIAMMSPFIWALMIQKISSTAYKALWLDSKYNHGPLVVVEVVRNVVGVLLVGFLVNQYFPFWQALLGTAFILACVLIVLRSQLQKYYDRIERRFLANLNARETADAGKSPRRDLLPWDAQVSEIEVNPWSTLIDKPLVSLELREKYGINIGAIKRGEVTIYAPTRDEKIFPHDTLVVIGTEEQLEEFGKVVDTLNVIPNNALNDDNVGLTSIMVDEYTGLKGQTVRTSGIREKTNALVVGIARGSEKILNPDSNTTFQWGDVIWLVGDRKRIKDFHI
ncbi:monovalent cation:H+ antiporter-2, CPA2 family [Chitinophaga terrae (ex Kim and Jung 2007)]|jgi:CPA2 family monovalent cation:H+ antiporter-2|uniref:Monovalent cation:H+ antiporter-2, CPA2 family n=1 Tax=Chitinophaga terrae (ex Kim and Jung 2007) TaxID=408074 RepID=A0A1H3XAJ2_9BACT|nr:cation:proton antiporter [Chitinophaga terrae (ex Kim and Jung 2007)]GEP89825.1 sodium:proton antiporter [Chitinophaga terrae (ex Kim and Jung 2007)]SDZ96416.1 monovalent cation:H+ antiporter-2, CPA2 family [Chitinophaga terrae (ex Kim and Jung 2007)]